ncbi:MAG: sensor domain-containing diguanylate cyclase [bacterium]|nr:sensor domain-containing diguanylate cyclase [bacterium]
MSDTAALSALSCVSAVVVAAILFSRLRRHLLQQQHELEKLLLQKQKTEIVLNRRLSEMSVIHEVSRALGSSLDLDKTLDMIVDVALRVMEAEYGSLYMLDDARKVLIPRRIVPLYHPEEAVELPLGDSITGWVAMTGESQNVPDLHKDWRFRDPLGRGGVLKTQLSVPLWSKGSVIGVLNIFNKKCGSIFDTDDMQFMNLLAASAARAIENARLYAEVRNQAIIDHLTGLYNFSYFQKRLEEEIRRASRYSRSLALVMFDLDDFKAYNDRFGHLLGNEALFLIGRVIKESIRDVDIAARFGGEEFVLLMPETEGEAVVSANRIREGVGRSHESAVNRIRLAGRLTISGGVAIFPQDGATPAELLDNADKALYYAKSTGKNRIINFDGGISKTDAGHETDKREP